MRFDSITRCAALSTTLGKAKGLLSVTAVLKFANSGSRIWRGYTITGQVGSAAGPMCSSATIPHTIY